MIINEIELCNLGVIASTEVLDLTPMPDKPVVLIGGKNGSGKTTILEVIQWVLYGTLAQLPRRSAGGANSYPDYLRRLRHRGADANSEAYAELRLSVQQGDRSVPVIVRRSIRNGCSRPSERLDVSIDGVHLPDRASEWPAYIDVLLPSQLCPLFFFDGEQIESMIDPAQSQRFLRAGVHALLGVDLIDQLVADLGTLERRERLAAAGSESTSKATALKSEQERLTVLVREARDKEAEARTKLDTAEKRVLTTEDSYRERGGTQYENRESTKRQLTLVEAERKQVEGSLRNLADGVLPLSLLSSLLRSHCEQAREQRRDRHHATEDAAALATLSELAQWLKDRGADSELLGFVTEFRREHHSTSAKTVSNNEVQFTDTAMSRLEAVIEGGMLADSVDRASTLLAELQVIEQRVADLSRALSFVPEEEDVKVLQQAVLTAVEARGRANATLRSAEIATKRMSIDLARVEKDRNDESLKVRLAKHEADRIDRLGGACQNTQGVLVSFRKAVVAANLRRIESAVWQKFQLLIHKKGLGDSIRIDPDSYELSILGLDGTPLPPERLSAGERQLLATSVLWGLAEVSGRRMPVIIDTPLGRLDKSHRGNLVTDYFPRAARQVVLLSTDEEITEQWFDKLSPYIARTYTLQFDDATQSSTIQPGYFEELTVVA